MGAEGTRASGVAGRGEEVNGVGVEGEEAKRVEAKGEVQAKGAQRRRRASPEAG